jgi:hypothetical protein
MEMFILGVGGKRGRVVHTQRVGETTFSNDTGGKRKELAVTRLRASPSSAR